MRVNFVNYTEPVLGPYSATIYQSFKRRLSLSHQNISKSETNRMEVVLPLTQ